MSDLAAKLAFHHSGYAHFDEPVRKGLSSIASVSALVGGLRLIPEFPHK